MSKEEETKGGNGDTALSNGPVAGERLAAARRDRELTVEEVAKELHLDEFKVRALERNEFDAIGAPVFAKGHLKKYSQIVGINPDDVLADYYQLNRTTGMPPVVGKVRKPQREFRPGRWLLLLLVLLIIAAAYWWLFERESVVTPPGTSSMPLPGDAEPAVSELERMPDVPSAVPVADDDNDEADSTAQPETVPEAEPVPPVPADQPLAAGEVRVAMTFSGDCWTEITDANGERLFFELGRAGRTATIVGEAPLSVLFGSADNVSLQVNGEDFAIADSDRRNQTARFSIGSP